MELNRVMIGDALALADALPSQSVHTIMTSPPYWRHRSYLPNAHPRKSVEIGRERTPEEYIENLVRLFRSLRNALRDDGTLWINIGDTMSTRPNGPGSHESSNLQGSLSGHAAYRAARSERTNGLTPGVKHKDLYGIPWMLAFALRADGWYLRSEVIWEKPNCSPESVRDRPTRSHETVFLLAKSERYYYDAEAIAEPAAESSVKRANLGKRPVSERHLAMQERGMAGKSDTMRVYDRQTRNKRSVWSIPTVPYSGEHFATFPPDLARLCIRAGTSERGCCAECGTPWNRQLEPIYAETTQEGNNARRGQGHWREGPGGKANREGRERKRIIAWKTIGWKAGCACGAAVVPCVVLDPFLGSGTTAEVCVEEGRSWLGFDINEKAVQQTAERLRSMPVRSLFANGAS